MYEHCDECNTLNNDMGGLFLAVIVTQLSHTCVAHREMYPQKEEKSVQFVILFLEFFLMTLQNLLNKAFCVYTRPICILYNRNVHTDPSLYTDDDSVSMLL